MIGKTDTIVLARHGKPALSRREWLNWRGYKYWWRLYDEGGLAKGQRAPNIIKALANEADKVISSPLRRAVETAELARGIPPDRMEPSLVEAALPPPNLGWIKLRPRSWGVLSRIKWCLGFSGGQESQKLARIRAESAASILSDEAAGGYFVFVTAHGWFNRMLRPALKRRGFTCTEDHGDLHWSYRRYERPTQEPSS